MRSFQFKYENATILTWRLESLKQDCELMPGCNVVFYITWTEDVSDTLPVITDVIERYFPESVYYGNESAGIMFKGNIFYGITVTCTIFEDPSVQTRLLWVEEGTECASLQDLWSCCRSVPGLRGIELIPSQLYLYSLKMDNSVPYISEDVIIFGGAAMNNENITFAATVMAKGHAATCNGMAVVLYCGATFNVAATYILGWKGLGRSMKVTKIRKNIIDEIDGVPAFSIYEKYLNLQPDERTTLVFPLIFEEDGIEFIRTPQAFLPDKSVQMIISVEEGSLARIAYGDKNTILRSLYDECPAIEAFAPQTIKAYSCLARRLFWGDDEIHKEIMPLKEIAPLSGFYSGGELLRIGKKLRVLNSTLVIISLREGEGTDHRRRANVPDRKEDTSLISRLTYFAEKIVREQEEQKIQLARRTVLSNYFLQSYSIAYYCDLSNGSLILLHGPKKIINDVESKFSSLTGRVTYYAEKYVHPDDREKIIRNFTIDNIRRQLQDSDDYSFTFRDFPGERIYRCTIIRGEDADHAAMGFLDITGEIRHQHARQEELQQALSMADSANRAKTEFLFNMSHDIRTPMNAIIGFIRMAEKYIDNKEKVLECLQKTRQAGDLLLSLINSILDVSRIESGKAVLNEQPGDVYYSFLQIESTMKEMAESKDISLSFEFGDITDRYVLCDFERCNRVFVNIITNAIKYTPEGGRVKVFCEQLGKVRDGRVTCRYIFEDNGIGMSEEFQKHVFEQFSREQNVTKSGIQGTGLGMAVCKSFVELMGGTIMCRSKQGEGSVFTVTLPFKVQQEQKYIDPRTKEIVSPADKEKMPVYQEIDFTGKKILVVEDNELNMEIICDILNEKGFVTESAEDGSVAVNMLKSVGAEHFDFILMDIQMPVMGGYEATKAIRAMYPDIHIPIIALSANAFAEDRAASRAAGMDGHVAKPVEVKELLQVLGKFM